MDDGATLAEWAVIRNAPVGLNRYGQLIAYQALAIVRGLKNKRRGASLMMFKRALAVAALMVCLSVAAMAGNVGDAAGQAETLAHQGNSIDALLAMDEAVGRLWDKLPLTVLESDFVAGTPGGYGNYDVRPDSRFKAGEKMLVYAELAAFDYGRDGDLFTIDIGADVELRDSEGKVVVAQPDFATFRYRSHVPNREFFAFMTCSFSGLKPGAYTLVTILRDHNSKKTGSFELPFTIE